MLMLGILLGIASMIVLPTVSYFAFHLAIGAKTRLRRVAVRFRKEYALVRIRREGEATRELLRSAGDYGSLGDG